MLPTTSITSALGARFTNDSPGVIDRESPPIHSVMRSVGENACCFGGSVVETVGLPGSAGVIGSGSDALMSSSPLRPVTAWSPRRISSICNAWLMSYSGSAKKRATSRRMPTGWPLAVLRIPAALSRPPTSAATSITRTMCPAGSGRRRGIRADG